MKLKTTTVATKTLLILFLGSLMACHNPTKPKETPKAMAHSITHRNIEFQSQGATLRGRLYVPKNNSEKKPVIIMAHGFTTTIKGMTADKYAEKFSEAGFAALIYDHINLGVSDGEPRQEVNFWVQARGYIDAMDFAITQPEIDTTKIAVWGASLSAREAFLVGSVDERVKAIINQIPAYGDDLPTNDKDGGLYSFAKETVLTEKIKNLPHTITEKMPIVSSDQLGTPSAISEITAYRWFIEYGGRFGTNWQNVVSFSRIETPDLFHIGHCTPYIKAPILMVVATNDEMSGANTKVTSEIFSAIKQPKEWFEVDGGHFGLLYYPSSIFDKSSQAQIDFLNKHFK